MRIAEGMLGCGLLCTAGLAQMKPSAAIPATEPTQSVSSRPSLPPMATGAPRGGSRVLWDGTTLTIQAGGDSLRGVLSQVARSTGMKVTGGVPDDRVFGSYGPGPAQQVLSQLFDGMYVNVMLVNGSPTKPKELILTARTGGPTPPSPAQPLTAADYTNPAFAQPGQGQSPNVQADRAGRRIPQGGYGQPPVFGQPATDQQQQPLVQGLSDPAQGTPVLPLGAAQENGVVTRDGVTTDANGTQQSPNGTLTPEQIFQQLRQRQTQQNAPPNQ